MELELVQLLEEVVNDCATHTTSYNFQTADVMVLNSEICSSLLEEYCGESSSLCNLSVSLSNVIGQLLVLWQTRLLNLENQRRIQTPGRPKILLNVEMVEFLREMGCTWQKCADIIMVSRTTLWRRIQELGIPNQRFTSAMISDSELDAVVKMMYDQSPNSGIVMVWGELQSRQMYVPRRRVRESLLRVGPQAVENRASRAVRRRVYSMPRSNALWHIDGLHCLIRWRIVVHGCIDGFSRKITYLRSAASTVLQLFLEATRNHGWPSRVRSDKGGENIDVAQAMLSVRGTDRSSHIGGTSVHNQRIERLWRDTFRHNFYALFYDLEEIGMLSPTNELQIFCLHYVFIPRLNKQWKQFTDSWNNHHLRSEHGLTPNQLWLRGMCSSSSDCIVDTDYGVEDGQSNPFDMGRVEIPRTDIILSEAERNTLKARFDPLANSEYCGVDIFMDVFEFLST